MHLFPPLFIVESFGGLWAEFGSGSAKEAKWENLEQHGSQKKIHSEVLIYSGDRLRSAGFMREVLIWAKDG